VFDKRTEVKPSAVSAQASEAGGVVTVTLTRKLADPAVPIVAGKRYTVAFAIHAGHTAKRFHYVSFERSLVLDQGAADFVAK
jgi:cytochrome c-type protein NapC